MDRRVRKSQQAIKNALVSLINEVGLENITVSSLCKKADINRSTFYLHYENIDDLIQSIESELSSHITSSISPLETDDILMDQSLLTNLFITILKSIKAESELVLALIATSDTSRTRITIEQVIENLILDRMNSVVNARPIHKELNVSPTYIAVLFSSIFTSILTEWLVNGLNESPEELAHFITETAYQPIIQHLIQL